MIKNFEIGKGGYSNELHLDGVIYDVHNQYDFEGIFIDAFRSLEIRFNPDNEYGKGMSPLTLKFQNIQYLEISPAFGTKEILGIDEMGYKEAHEKCDDWLDGEEHINDKMHFFLRLIPNDIFIRVFSEHATLLIKKTRIKDL